MKKTAFISKEIDCCSLISTVSFSFIFKCFFPVLILLLISDLKLKAQDNFIDYKGAIPFVYDQIPVLVIVVGYKNFYVDAIYTNNDVLYVNISDLFKTLEIPCIIGQKGKSLSGFIENESRTYFIDYNTRQIKIVGKMINSENGLINEMGSIYMETSLFAETFGITLAFNYRALTIILKSDFELPIVKQQRIEKLRNNLSKFTGVETADTVLQRNYHLFKLGMLDWSAASVQTMNGSTDNRFGISLGTELLYGEADVSLNYYDRQKFDNRQLYYLWRWVDNDKPIIKQAQIGKISNQTISFINAPLIGAVVRNSPTTVRKATGYYTISEFTEPNWTVELYINNVMVDYTKADASGLYLFKVPIVYGYTTLKLKFFGPMGEERTEERTMNMPYTIMPANEFEYGLSAGIVQDSSRGRFGRAEFNYGANRFLTLGGGLEYLSSIPNGAFIPYAKATIQPFSSLTINAEYAHGVKTRGLLDYYFWENALLEIDYTKFVEGQLATRFNALEERRIKLSVPFRYKKIIGFSKVDYSQFVYKAFNYNQTNIMISAYYKQFSTNSSTQLNWIDHQTPNITTDLSLSYRLKNGYTIRQSAQYNASEDRFIMYKAAIEKSIPKGYLIVTYERSFMSDHNLLSLNFKYDLAFARTNVNIAHSKGNLTIAESAQGSLAFGSGNNYILKSNNSSVSKGGISLYPFLDVNHNGVFDKDEHLVKLTTIRVFGGKVIFSEKDSIIRITELNSFTNYIMEFNDYDLGNIAWRFKNKKYQVLIDPNQFKRIDIPIIPVGEVSGMVYMKTDSITKGIGRILIKFYQKNSLKVVAEILSEFDGYIYYLGLEPGEYVARVDPVQLSNLDFTTNPTQMDFTIKTDEEGDMIGGIDFVLQSEQKIATQPELQKNTPSKPLPNKMEQISTVKDTIVYIHGDTLYKVQLLALHSPIKVKDCFIMLLVGIPGIEIVETLGADGYYHYTAGSFKSLEEAMVLLRSIKEIGWKDCFISTVKDTTVYIHGDTLYKVQLLALHSPIKVKDYFIMLLVGIPSIEIVETLGADGYYRYTAGSFKSLEEAMVLLQSIKEFGWKDCFITTGTPLLYIN